MKIGLLIHGIMVQTGGEIKREKWRFKSVFKKM